MEKNHRNHSKKHTLFSRRTEKELKEMLIMEQIYRIRNLTKIEGKSLRQTAKETGHDFETVKEYSEKQDFNQELRKKHHVKVSWILIDRQLKHG